MTDDSLLTVDGAPESAAMQASRLRALEPAILAATRAAALACQRWVGRGDPKAADGAATEAMRRALAAAPGSGVVIIGEGEKDGAPMLYNGERVGGGGEPRFDIAVDPLECTGFCAEGLPGALATMAIAMHGTLWSPGPAHYMDKLVVGPGAREAIDIEDSPEANLARIADALGKPVSDLQVVVMDKPRHQDLIKRLRAAGAAVSTPANGDVAGALAALLPDGDADVLMGIGGTPEGAMTACAVRALGGGMQGRLAPQRPAEAQACADAGIDVDAVLDLDDLLRGPAIFVATGVSGGSLLRRPWTERGQPATESLVIGPGLLRRIVDVGPGGANEPGQSDHAKKER